MSAPSPWSVKGIDPKAREVAKDLARRSGMTLGEWLNRMIMEDDGEAASDPESGFRRPQAPVVLDHHRQRRAESEWSSRPLSPDADRLAEAVQRLTDRMEAAEHRQAMAIAGIDQSVREAVARIEASERQGAALTARVEDAVEDLSAEQTQALERLRQAVGDPQAFQQKLADRLDAAEARTSDALLDLSASFVALDERLKVIEEGGAEQRLGDLAAHLADRIEAVREEMQARIEAAVAGGEGRAGPLFEALTAHVEAAEKRSAQAIEKMGREVISIAGVLNKRMQAVETHAAEAVDQMQGEMARIAANMDSKLARADAAHAQALERLGGEIARITERLSERIANSERRNAEAIDDVGEQVARVGERLTERQERVYGEFAERIRQSEQRTAQFLDEARETIDHSLSEARRRLAEAAPPPAPAPEPEPAYASVYDEVADPHFDEGRFSYGEVGSPREPHAPLTAQVFARPTATDRFEAAEEEDVSEAETAFRAFQDDFDDDFMPVEPDDAYDALETGSTYMLGPDSDPHPVRVRTTREAVEQARAAARSAGHLTSKSDGLLFSGLLSGMGKKRGGAGAQTVAFVVGGVAALGFAATGLILTGQNNRAAQLAQEDAARAAPPGQAAANPARAAVAVVSPNLTAPGMPATTPPDSATLYGQAVSLIEAGDGAGLAQLRKVAESGYAPAQFYLAKLYETGGAGLKKNEAEARRWTERAAQAGDRKAMHNLGLYNFEGVGGAKNPANAALWFRKAADLGLVDSQYNLGRLYEAGYGVSQNAAEAYKWYLIAARAGDAESRASAGRVRAQLTAEAQAAAERSAAGFRGAGTSTQIAAATTSSATGVVTAQRALSRLGYYQGPEDGVSSPALRLAISAYQRDQGLLSSGVLDPELVSRLAAFAK